VVGDIIAYAGGAQVVVAREISPVLLGLPEVNKFKAVVAEIPPYQLKVEEQPQRTINCTVASVRLDAVLSSGLGIGRGKAVDLIKADKVKVNWRHIGRPGFQLSAGDVLSIRGRLELAEVGVETKKGRTRITLKKYS
jgi:RNA-binding protein YlmH